MLQGRAFAIIKRVLAQTSRPGDLEKRKENGREL